MCIYIRHPKRHAGAGEGHRQVRVRARGRQYGRGRAQNSVRLLRLLPYYICIYIYYIILYIICYIIYFCYDYTRRRLRARKGCRRPGAQRLPLGHPSVRVQGRGVGAKTGEELEGEVLAVHGGRGWRCLDRSGGLRRRRGRRSRPLDSCL